MLYILRAPIYVHSTSLVRTLSNTIFSYLSRFALAYINHYCYTTLARFAYNIEKGKNEP